MTDDFNLEPAPLAGEIPERVIDELRHARRVAKDYAQAYADAAKAQAEKHHIQPAALKKFIAALEEDTIEQALKEAADLEKLIG